MKGFGQSLMLMFLCSGGSTADYNVVGSSSTLYHSSFGHERRDLVWTDPSWTTGGKKNILVIITVPEEEAGQQPPANYFEDWDKDMKDMQNFFRSNSGDKFNPEIEVVPRFVPSAVWTRKMCQERKCSFHPVDLNSQLRNAYIESGESKAKAFDRSILVFRGGCSCFPMGSASIHGWGVTIAMDDTSNFRRIAIAHELGHTNGAHHASFGSDSYGNTYSVMGNSAPVPEGHFTVPGKTVFKWLDSKTQIASFARQGHPECDPTPVEGGICRTSGQVWLRPHDITGYRYEANKIYGVKIYTGQPGAYLWLEYREQIRHEGIQVDGVTMLWSPENVGFGPRRNEYIGTYGATHMIDYMPHDPHRPTKDVQIPVGGVYLYDLDGVGAKIRVLEKSQEEGLLVDIEFVARTFETDYAYGPESRVTDSTYCDGYTKVKVSLAGKELNLYRFFVAQPSKVTLKFMACTSGSKVENIGKAYLYPSYPLHLVEKEGKEDFDPRPGSLVEFDVKCTGENHLAEINLHNEWTVGADIYGVMSLEYYLLLVEHEESTGLVEALWFNPTCTQAAGACRDNFYYDHGAGECVQCALGLRARRGATSANDCYNHTNAIRIESETSPSYNGVYVQGHGAHRMANFYVHTPADGSGEKLYLYRDNFWRLSRESRINNGYTLPVLTHSDPHPLAKGSVLDGEGKKFVITPVVDYSDPPGQNSPGQGDALASPYNNEFEQLPGGWSYQIEPPAVPVVESPVEEPTLNGGAILAGLCGALAAVLVVGVVVVRKKRQSGQDGKTSSSVDVENNGGQVQDPGPAANLQSAKDRFMSYLETKKAEWDYGGNSSSNDREQETRLGTHVRTFW